MKVPTGWEARAEAALWRWAGKFLWSCICLLELLVSTILHIGFGAFIVHSALATDVLALLPNLLKPFQPASPSSSNPSSSSSSESGSPPPSPAWSSSSSPRGSPSYSYLLSCSVLFSSSSTYPSRLAAWLRRSASAWSTLRWGSSPRLFSSSDSLENASSADTCEQSKQENARRSQSSQCGGSSSSTTSRGGTSLLQLDVPVAGNLRRSKRSAARSWIGLGSDDSETEVETARDEAEEAGNAPSRPAPICLLHGIFGFGHGRLGQLSYFGGVERQHEGVLVPDLGSLTSLHDRARRLFYYLKGGTVDYGEEHSKACAHSRFGITLPGQHQAWGENNPVHLVGHSAGVQVARLLQQMLADKEFEGYETSADWVASITSLSGALNGTTRVYIDGLLPDDGETMTPVSLLQVLRFGVLVYEWLDLPFMGQYYSFGFEHFGLSWRKTGLRGIWDSWVRGVTGPFRTGDWILPDLSIQHALRLNSTKIKTHPNTYYFSYATVATQQHSIMGHRLVLPAGLSTVHPLFTLRCLQMSLWKFPTHKAPLPYKGFRDDEWQHNDGALNVVSMLYPLTPDDHTPCSSEGWMENEGGGSGRDSSRRRKGHRRRHRQMRRPAIPHPHQPMPTVEATPSQSPQQPHSDSDGAPWCSVSTCSQRGFPVHCHTDNQPFSPGVWYYSLLEADHILFVISRRRAGVHFDILYRTIFARCRKMGPSMMKSQSSKAKGSLGRAGDFLELGPPEARVTGAGKDAAASSFSSSLGGRGNILYDSSSSIGSSTSSRSSFSSTSLSVRNSGDEKTAEEGLSASGGSEDEEEAAWMDVLEKHSSWEQDGEVQAMEVRGEGQGRGTSAAAGSLRSASTEDEHGAAL